MLFLLSETVSPISSLRTYLNWNVRHSFFEVNIFLRIPCYNFLVRTIIIRLFFSAERSLLFLVIRKFLQIPLNWSFAAFVKVVVGKVDASIHEDEVFWALGRSLVNFRLRFGLGNVVDCMLHVSIRYTSAARAVMFVFVREILLWLGWRFRWVAFVDSFGTCNRLLN